MSTYLPPKKNQSTVAGLLDKQVSSPVGSAEMGADGRLVQHQSQNHQSRSAASSTNSGKVETDGRLVQHQSQNHHIPSADELEVGNDIIPTSSPNKVSRKEVI